MTTKSSLQKIDHIATNCYPFLLVQEDEHHTLVILFNDFACGTVVLSKGDTNWNVGDYADDWPMADFRLFNDAIRLSNG
jgi:hypothetical protein